MSKAGLWSWFLFESGLGTQRAKELLSAWETHAWSLQEALDRAMMQPTRVGLTSTEGKRLRPPGLLPFVDALAWDDPHYPCGLNELPIRLRPALLFYKGEPTLMARPIVYLAPADLKPDSENELREIVNLLIGEDLLFSAYSQSAQAQILLSELAYGQGEALLFVGSGLKTHKISQQERSLIAEDRLLLISPLAPHTPHRPSLTAVLQHVAVAAANRIILSGAAANHPTEIMGLGDKPALAVDTANADVRMPPNVQRVSSPTDVLTWIGLTSPVSEFADPTAALDKSEDTAPPSPQSTDKAYGLGNEELGLPPSPEEIIDTLQRGGNIPEALRRRLKDQED